VLAAAARTAAAEWRCAKFWEFPSGKERRIDMTVRACPARRRPAGLAHTSGCGCCCCRVVWLAGEGEAVQAGASKDSRRASCNKVAVEEDRRKAFTVPK